MAATPTPGSPLLNIDPDNTTGTELANDSLDPWALYLASSRRTESVPDEVVEGTVWFRNVQGGVALMIAVRNAADPDTESLGYRELFRFQNPEDGGGQIPLGVEVFIGAIGTPPASGGVGEGDLWLIPGGIAEGVDGALTNWQMKVYTSSAWVDVIHKENTNILLTEAVLGTPPTYSTVEPYYGNLWMDCLPDTPSSAQNNGLRVWNGSDYIPAWPVIDGQTMMKTTVSGVDPASSPEIGLAHINTATKSFWVATGTDFATDWIDLTETLIYVTLASELDTNPYDRVMNPYWSEYQIEQYRIANTIDRYSGTRIGTWVQTLSSGGGAGKIDPSLTLTTGLGYKATFIAAPGSEYPDANPSVGDYWICLNDPSYTFVDDVDVGIPGDLKGQTIFKGQGIAFNNAGAWEIVDVLLNTDAFVHRDGSLSVYEPLMFTDSLGANAMVLDYQSIIGATGGTFSILPNNPGVGQGLHVFDTGNVGIGVTATGNRLEVKGAGNDTPGEDNNVLALAAENDTYDWLGFRYGPTLSTWNLDTEVGGVANTRLSIGRVSGNIGIGVLDPQHTLHVAGPGYFTGNVTSEGALIAGAGLNVTGDITGSNTALITGNVGIGPGATLVEALNVVGNIAITGVIKGPDTGWSTTGVTGFKYRKLSNGVVEIRTNGGEIPGGAMPDGYRPEDNIHFLVDAEAKFGQYAQMGIAALDGDVTCDAEPGDRMETQVFHYYVVGA